MGKSQAHCIGFAFISLVWFFVFLFLFAIFLEYGAGIRLYQRIRYGSFDKGGAREGVYETLREAYRPFTIQHLHPLYLFSFPLEPEERLRVSNAVVRLGEHGFRGAGPDERGDRKLAFFIGGSAAFGHFATSDKTTITGYLNEKQDQYHFVNAGVPSWNTQQELHRLVDELLAYEPALVVAFHGSNDVAIALDYARKGKTYGDGAPESFDALHELVDDIRGARKPEPKPFYERAFPELTRHVRNALGTARKPVRHELSNADLDRLADRTAARYLYNVNVMRRVLDSFDTRFLAVLQPVADLHKNVTFVPDENSDRRTLHASFRENVLARKGDLPIIDFGNLFDDHFERISSFQEGAEDLRTDEHIFVDHVHFTDRGNEIIAGRIIELLRERGWLERIGIGVEVGWTTEEE